MSFRARILAQQTAGCALAISSLVLIGWGEVANVLGLKQAAAAGHVALLNDWRAPVGGA